MSNAKAGLYEKRFERFSAEIIACIIMVIDHAGALFFPDKLIFRIIGRVAFPIFAFFIAEGFFHTRSVRKYLARLGICAVLFQIPDWFSRVYAEISGNPDFGVRYKFNIFATLFFGLLAVTLYDRLKSKKQWLSWTAALAVAILAETAGADYGAYGVLYILVFYLTRENILYMLFGVISLHMAYAAYDIVMSLVTSGTVIVTDSIQLYSLMAIPLIALYNNERGRKAKYVFYVFYPVHLIVLYVIDLII
ncbi:TraX family protein [Thermoclostridium stercorarium]|uniref:TraX family protein n=1 Tax=Thermoclostridium stercorarium TaxID=1510 RepID=UPI002091EB42|nr:TraX family protein [Thermoclostridium stercorarium]